MKYSLGLDIGVASIGWAVIDEEKQRIHDLGVRIFERAEDPQSGESLATPRRDARSARKRLRRRHQRLDAVKRFFIDHDLLNKTEVKNLLSVPNNPYPLRAKALDEKLTNEELFVAIYHIAKRRGYKSNRKVDANEGKTSETGRVLQALSVNQRLLEDNHYRTVGEALQNDEKYTVHKRNKRDDYMNSFGRKDFIDELVAIIDKQREFGLKISGDDARQLVYGVDDNENIITENAIMYQRPFMTRELMEKMIGECTFEKGEKRAPRGSFSFETFRLASELAHVVFIPKEGYGLSPDSVTLSPDTIEKIIEEVKDKPTLTYKKVRQLAGVGDDYKFMHVRGKIAEDDPCGEKNIFGSLKAYHDVKKAFADLSDEWKKVDNEAILDEIALTLTIQKTDKEIKDALNDLDLSKAAKEELIKVKSTNFKTFGHLSIKALRNITPHIIKGNTYDKACELAGYDFRKKGVNLEQITNPVVKRSISQVLKVVKAVRQKYGKPYYIRIETSRDLAKNFQDRKNIEREQKENQDKNEKVKLKIQERGITDPTGQQIIKFKLYDEQNCKSLYSGLSIDIDRLFADNNTYQIDHIIPFSRSGNDGLANKALVTTEENQLKGNQTPFEAFGPDEAKWKQFVANVEATYITRSVKEGDGAEKRENYKYNGYAFKKKNNLLVQDYKNNEWNARALNDTRYITRFIQNYLRQTVDFAEGADKQRTFTPNGTLTSYMRKRWGLVKIREQDVLHHAADAAIVAVMSQGVIQRANLYAKRGEVKRALQNAKTMKEKTDLLTGEITDEEAFNKAQLKLNAHKILTEDHFPQPWPRFRDEVDRRTKVISAEELQNEMRGFDNYDEEFRLQAQPIFVSRMPNRKAKGPAHKETLRSKKVDENDMRTVRTPITSIKLKDLAMSPVKDTDPQLYETLRSRLEEFGDKPEKAFATPIYKKNKYGDNAHSVRAIKVASKQPSGFYINNGEAFVNNGSIVRLDIYRKANVKGRTEHFFVPIYTHQISKEKKGKRITQILPAPKNFSHIDETFTKITTVFPNDYVRIYFGNKIEEGYYKSYDASGGTIKLLNHSAADQTSLNRISARSAVSIERFDISILGDNAPRV